MPSNGMQLTPEFANATQVLDEAYQSFRTALAAAQAPRPDGPVFSALRSWRTSEARSKQVPPYVIATDAMLRSIEEARPNDLEALAAVKGFGGNRAATYGDAILDIVAKAA